MTAKQINEQLIKDVETAVNNVANAYNGAFKIKKSDEGTDRVSNFTLRLTSSEWNKDAQIKFSIDRPSEYVGDANDPIYYAACEMGMRVNLYDGFVGTKHSIELSGKPTKEKVGKFIEEIFLPTSIEILKFAKANKRKYPSVAVKKLKDFYKDMWKGTIKKVPTEEQIEQLFTNEQTNESKRVGEASKKPGDFIKNIGSSFRDLSKSKEISEEKETYEEYMKRFEEARQKAIDASKKFSELILDKEFDEAYRYIHSNEFARDISWFGDPRKQIEHFEDSLFASKEIASKHK